MKSLMSIILMFVISSINAQQIDWAQTKDWTLYDIHDDNAFNYSLDTLKNFGKFSLNNSILLRFLRNSDMWPKGKTSLWMGLYVTTCRTADGLKHKIDISVYGGFFYEEDTRTYGAVDSSIMDEWLQYFLDSMNKLTSSDKPNN